MPEPKKEQYSVERPAEDGCTEDRALEESFSDYMLEDATLKQYHKDSWLNEVDLTKNPFSFSELEALIASEEEKGIEGYRVYQGRIEDTEGNQYPFIVMNPYSDADEGSDNLSRTIIREGEDYPQGIRFIVDGKETDAELTRIVSDYQETKGLLEEYLSREDYALALLTSEHRIPFAKDDVKSLIYIGPEDYSSVPYYAIPSTNNFIIGQQPEMRLIDEERPVRKSPGPDSEMPGFEHNDEPKDTPDNPEDTAGTGIDEDEDPFDELPAPWEN